MAYNTDTNMKLNSDRVSSGLGENQSQQNVMQILSDLSPKIRQIWDSVVNVSGPGLSKGRDFAVAIPGHIRANPWPYIAGASILAFGLLYRRGAFSSFLGSSELRTSRRSSRDLSDQAVH